MPVIKAFFIILRFLQLGLKHICLFQTQAHRRAAKIAAEDHLLPE
jgi:hypothetical protein